MEAPHKRKGRLQNQMKKTQSEEGSEVKEDENLVKSTVAAWDVSKGRCLTPGSLQTY